MGFVFAVVFKQALAPLGFFRGRQTSVFLLGCGAVEGFYYWRFLPIIKNETGQGAR
jgi:hypothetical protein